jgi:hypothetical protein
METYSTWRKKLDPDNIIMEQKAEIARLRWALELARDAIRRSQISSNRDYDLAFALQVIVEALTKE